MENKRKYEIILSSDGKMTLLFGADHESEASATFEKVKPLFEKMIKLMKDNDLQRKTGGGFPPKKEAVVVGKCPTCGADLIEGVTKAGKKYHKCSTNKWDAAQGKATGCEFIKWL